MATLPKEERQCVDLTGEEDEIVEVLDEEDDAGEEEEEDTTEEDACCICQDTVQLVKQGFLSSCDHRFHFDCIVTWSKVTNLCPLCKLKFNQITRQNEQGSVVHCERIADTKQVFRPDPRDHDVAAQLQLVNNVRCESCGRGDDEHVLLMCEAPNCMHASHTYCAGLSEVPSHSWYCTRHQGGPARASDLIARPASTVSTRRRTRRLASLMSNIMSGVGAVRRRATTSTSARTASRVRSRGGRTAAAAGRLTLPDGDGTSRPIRGVALSYAVHMSRELQAIQQRADAMFARGDLGANALYAPPRSSVLGAARSARSTTDRIWDDYATSRRQLAEATAASESAPATATTGSAPMLSNQRANANRISPTFATEYRDLAKRMADAASHDNYASTVSLIIPKTARLRLVSSAKTFFGRLNEKEKLAALDAGCLSLLFSWIHVTGTSTSTSNSSSSASVSLTMHPHVLEGVLTVLESLPVRKQDLHEVKGFRKALDEISNRADVGLDLRERCIVVSEKWREIDPPGVVATPTTTRLGSTSTANSVGHGSRSDSSVTPAAQAPAALPAIQAFATRSDTGCAAATSAKALDTPGKSAAKRKRIVTVESQRTPESHKTRRHEEWTSAAVEYVKAKFYPVYKDSKGAMSKDQFKAVIKLVLERFRVEAASMQSRVVEQKEPTQLTGIAKKRLVQLLDQVYKETRASGTSGTRVAATGNANYSAVPSSLQRPRGPTTTDHGRLR